MRRAGTSTSTSSTAAAGGCRASARRSSRMIRSSLPPSNVFWRKRHETFHLHALPRLRGVGCVGSGQERAERGAEEAAGAHEGLQREGGRQEGRGTQELHELLPQG